MIETFKINDQFYNEFLTYIMNNFYAVVFAYILNAFISVLLYLNEYAGARGLQKQNHFNKFVFQKSLLLPL